MGAQSLTLACGCGRTELGLMVEGRGSATRVTCYCTDCQAAARHLGYELPAHGGTDLLHSTPDRITILRGATYLSALRLSPKGLVRWYANCCNTPMVSTLPKPGLPFAGLVVHAPETRQADKVAGRVWGHAFTKNARPGGGAPAKDRNFGGVGLRLMARMLAAFVSGRHRINPLRAENGDWIVEPHVLTRDERRAAERR